MRNRVVAGVAVGVVAASMLSAPQAAAANPSCTGFDSGTAIGVMYCDVPANGTYVVTVTGAGGGGGGSLGVLGGKGAIVSYTLSVFAGQTLTLEVGQGGATGYSNGGGVALGGGGGGWSAILDANGALLVVAGGGGGGGGASITNSASPATTYEGADAGMLNGDGAQGKPSAGYVNSAGTTLEGGFGGTSSFGPGAGGNAFGGASFYWGSAGAPGAGGSGARAGDTPGIGTSGANRWQRGVPPARAPGSAGADLSGGGGGAGYFGGGGGAATFTQPGLAAAGGGGSGSSYPPTATITKTRVRANYLTNGTNGRIQFSALTPAPPSAWTVTYDGNGATGGSAPPTSGPYSGGTSVTASSTEGSLVRAGYTFTGWNTAADGTGTAIAPGSAFTITGNITLYAQWTPATQYTLSYDGNGSTSGTVPPQQGPFYSGDTVTTALPGTMARAGFTFSGWNTRADGTGTAIIAGTDIVITTSFTITPNIVLYAQWTPVPPAPSYTVSYDGNGSTSGSAPLSTGPYESGDPAYVAPSGGTLERTGYTFTGWNTHPDGLGVSVVPGSTITVTGDVTLYAQWTPIPVPTYTLSYDGNGSTGGAAPASSGPVPSGTAETVAAVGSLARTGFTFAGWNTTADGSGTSYASGSTVTVTGDVTLFAQWTPIPVPTYTVSYDVNGSTGGTAPASSGPVPSGGTETAAGVGSLTRNGYTFAGWNTAADGSGTSYAAGATITVTGDVTLFAQWTPIPTYTVTYDGNGSTGGVAPGSSGPILSGGSDTVSGSGSLARTGYAFAGWNTRADGTGTAYAAGATVTVTGNVTLYAQWVALPTYTVTYDGNGATSGSAPATTGPYLAGDTATVAGSAASLVRTGFTFSGWNTRADGTGTPVAPGSSFTVTADETLYAQWTLVPPPPYTVSYDGNGATGGTAPASAGGYLSGDPATVSATEASLVRTGSTFSGWNTRADGLGTPITPGSTITVLNDVTLYAQWVALPPYTAVYDGNGATAGVAPASQGPFLGTVSATASVTEGTLVRPGYVFVGWNTRADGFGTAIVPGATFTISSNLTLYAQWTALPTYTVTYVGNGSTSGTAPASAGPFLAGDTATVATQATLARTGYTFAGWNTRADGTGASITPGSTVTITGDETLYAQWTPVPAPPSSGPPPPEPVTPPSTPTPGEAVVTQGGRQIPGTTRPGPDGTTVKETDGRGSLTIGGLEPDGTPSTLGPDGELVVKEGTQVTFSGSGFKPGSRVALYILDPSIALCELTADASGTVSGVCDVPGTLAPGRYIVQAAGRTPNGEVRSVSLPLRVIANRQAATRRERVVVYFDSLEPTLDATDRGKLDRLLRRIPKGATGIDVQVLGFVQPVGPTSNDTSLSTARARNTAAYLKANGLAGAYYVSGRGRASEQGWKARRAEVVVSYTVGR